MSAMYHHALLHFLIVTVLKLQSQVAAQVPHITLDFYTKSSCLTNNNDLDNLSKSVDIFKELGMMTLDQNGHIKHSCLSVMIDLVDWPRDNPGSNKYITYLDTKSIESGCQVHFYDVPQKEEELDPSTCAQYYRQIGPNSGCTRLDLNQMFGLQYCCGQTCETAVLEGTVPVRRQEPVVKDVTKIKRAPLLGRDACNFNRSDPNIRTTFGQQFRVFSFDDICHNDAGCPMKHEFTITKEIKDSKGLNVGGTVQFNEIFGLNLGGEFSWENTQGESVKAEGTTGPAYGQKGFATFTPLLKCAKGKPQGPCAQEVLEMPDDWYCVLAMSTGRPDGKWGFVATTE